jgi:hypothetical protein
MGVNRRRFIGGVLAAGASGPRSLVAASAAASPQAIWSASAKQPPQIVYEAAAGETVRFAAMELERYLEAILGVALPPAAGAQAAPRLVLRVVDDEDLGEEGFEIACDGTELTISGHPSGIAYGAFEFLRRFAGCQFSGLGSDCEFTPRLERIDVGVARLRMKPKLWYRGYQFFYAEPLDLILQRLDWMVRNGLNYVMFTPRRDDIVGPDAAIDPATGQPAGGPNLSFTEGWWKSKVEPEVVKRGLKLDFNHHNLFYWVPPHRYFEKHPEWYPLVDGQRTTAPRQLAICTSNEEAVATLVENVKLYLRENPRIKIVGVIVEDGSGMCQCDNCLRGDVNRTDAFRADFDYKFPEAENKSKSLRYARLVNRVAREIRDEFPGVLVGHPPTSTFNGRRAAFNWSPMSSVGSLFIGGTRRIPWPPTAPRR